MKKLSSRSTSAFFRSRTVVLAVLSLAIALPICAAGQATAPPTPDQPAFPTMAPTPAPNGVPPSISLSPAVIMARGSYGQGLTQTLMLTNNTGMDFAFELQAEDVIVQEGKRAFVAAGETANSIAASAVFSQKAVVVKSHSSASVDVRFTLPAETKIRAVIAVFRGTNKLPSSNSAVGMTASLGALITFNLSDNIKLQPEPLKVTPGTESANLTVSQWITNVGTEPVLPDGMAVLLNAQGGLISKIPLPAQRLLPGERLEFAAEYADQLQPGDYKAMCTLQFEGKTLTSDAPFRIR